MSVTFPPPQPDGLPAALDFYRLRREGIEHIERTASASWTDYNTHDPGITLLEALAYAITELGYRARFDIADILASARGATADDPYPGQAFPTAREILTVNPTTADDLRRLLIDSDVVRNAWVRCSRCDCGTGYYAWCDDGELVLSHQPVPRDPASSPVRLVEPRGLYDVLLDLEADPEAGDLNDPTIVRSRSVLGPDGSRHLLTAEVRFPRWPLARRDEQRQLVAAAGPLPVTPGRLTLDGREVDDAGLRRRWTSAFSLDCLVTLGSSVTVGIDGVAVRVFGDEVVRDSTTVADLVSWLADSDAPGFVAGYRDKLHRLDRVRADVAGVLAAHRNLDEDHCHIGVVEITDLAVCADIEVEPTVDVDLVQASIWFELERYLDPPVAFWSADELRARGVPVEDIFAGPELRHGFLTEDGLRATELRTEVRTSDLIRVLSGIAGVISVQNLRLTAYSAAGTPLPSQAERPADDAGWLLVLPPEHRPRLHRRLSRFLFRSDGLPFRPRLDEAEDTLVELRGRSARPKLREQDLDLPLPRGRRRDLGAYHPVQNSLPVTYGIGPAGLSSAVSGRRRAQASQLKAYLLVFEQLLRNSYAQLEHVADLFSLDPAVDHSYFSATLDPAALDPASGTEALRAATITDYAALVDPRLTADVLARLVEPEAEFRDRRNRFLDHLLARFGETFAAYPMLLTDPDGRSKAAFDLIRDKLAFLRALPHLGHDRGRGFDRTRPADAANTSGLQRRVEFLLGLPGRPGWDTHRRAIVVEHLLLRPKFPGDALYPACTDGPCRGCGCGDEDPYSFRLTYVMPGWTEPFSTDLAARRFAEQAIREQTPAHLLIKICWVGNDGYLPNECDPIIDALAAALEGATAGREAACAAALDVHDRYRTAFQAWFDLHRLVVEPSAVLASRLAGVFDDRVDLSTVSGAAIDQQLRDELQELLVAHFAGIAGHGYQFQRFEDAWRAWAEADADLDWTAERLQETVLELLAAGVAEAVGTEALTNCAATMLAAFGTVFETWIGENVAAGRTPEAFTRYEPPATLPECGLSFADGVVEAVLALLETRYERYVTVSYRLRLLVEALAGLRNSYPRATLHDCDDGSDDNPVRLGHTALGSNRSTGAQT